MKVIESNVELDPPKSLQIATLICWALDKERVHVMQSDAEIDYADCCPHPPFIIVFYDMGKNGFRVKFNASADLFIAKGTDSSDFEPITIGYVHVVLEAEDEDDVDVLDQWEEYGADDFFDYVSNEFFEKLDDFCKRVERIINGESNK